jgi:hypothetical protein
VLGAAKRSATPENAVAHTASSNRELEVQAGWWEVIPIKCANHPYYSNNSGNRRNYFIGKALGREIAA